MSTKKTIVKDKIGRCLLKEYVIKKINGSKSIKAGLGSLEIQKTLFGTDISLEVEKPGIVIGKRGQFVKSITNDIEEKFKINNVLLNINEIKNPNLNAQIISEKLASSIERGGNFRKLGHQTVKKVMDAGARGCHILISGKLTGQRKRKEKFKDGHIKFCGETKLKFLSKGFTAAQVKLGTIGVTVEIMDLKTKLPTDVLIKENNDIPNKEEFLSTSDKNNLNEQNNEKI